MVKDLNMDLTEDDFSLKLRMFIRNVNYKLLASRNGPQVRSKSSNTIELSKAFSLAWGPQATEKALATRLVKEAKRKHCN